MKATKKLLTVLSALALIPAAKAATVFEFGTDIIGNTTTNSNLTDGVNENVLRWRTPDGGTTELVGYISFDLVGDVDGTYTLTYDIDEFAGSGAFTTDIHFVGLFDGAAGEIDANNINTAFQASITTGALIATDVGSGDDQVSDQFALSGITGTSRAVFRFTGTAPSGDVQGDILVSPPDGAIQLAPIPEPSSTVLLLLGGLPLLHRRRS